MLSRQVAPLLRKFCKVSAYFTIASQRGHALTMLRSFKVILNFSTQYHVAHADSFPSFQHVNNITKHDHRAIAHPISALSWGNASRDARQAMPGSNLKMILVLTTGSTA